MKLFERRNAFLEACNNVLGNKRLYNSIINLQNDLIVFANCDPKIIGIVAPLDRLHSSLMAKAIAEVYAHNNKKTLLIDLDMHIPTIDKLFKLENTKSILDITANKFNSVVNEINDKLDVIVSKIEINYSTFLVSDEFKKSLLQLKDYYNHIIIALPPVLDNQDILLVKEYLDAVLLVSKKNETMIKTINKSIEFIKENNINFVGTVFIK